MGESRLQTHMHTRTHTRTQMHSHRGCTLIWLCRLEPPSCGVCSALRGSCNWQEIPALTQPSLPLSIPPPLPARHSFMTLNLSSPLPPAGPHSNYHQSSYHPLWGSGPDWQLRFLSLLLPGLGVVDGPAVHVVLPSRLAKGSAKEAE